MSSSYRFADYFAVCGLDEKSDLEPEETTTGSVGSVSPFIQCYKASVLCHAPKEVHSNPFDENGIKMLCFPRGLKFQLNYQPDPSFHSFLLTREDGSRVYCCALTFFEKVENDSICAAMCTLSNMYDTEQSSPRKHDDVVTSREAGFNSGIETDVNTRRYSTRYDPVCDTLYCPKCICLVMQQPFISAAETYLRELHRISMNEIDLTLHTESFVYNILFEVPTPPPGRTLRFTCGGASITSQQPNIDELPLLDYSIKELFLTLGIENVVDLYTCVLLEHQILLVGSELHKFMLISEAITGLLFPLHWQHVYVPILPSSLLHFLDAPVPFIMGVYCQTNEDKAGLDIPYESSLCLLDIDENYIELPTEVPHLPGRDDLIKELADVLSKYNVQPPQGQIYLRALNTGRRSDEYDSNSSFESLNDELESSNEKSQRVPLKKAASFRGPRSRGRQSTGERPRMRRLRSHSSSPSMRRKTSKDISSMMQPRTVKVLDDKKRTNQEEDERKGKEISNGSKTLPNPRLAAMLAIAQKAGIDPSSVIKKNRLGGDLSKATYAGKENFFIYGERAQQISRKIQHESELNIIVRDVFLNRFTQLLVEYESFVIIPKQDKEQWLANREHMHNFDKAAFLSDQSTFALPFMTLFVETQAFASLIDMKILASWDDTNPRLSFFDKKRDLLKVRLGIIRSHVYERCIYFPKSIDAYIKRSNHVDYTAQAPHVLKPQPTREKTRDHFPMLQTELLVDGTALSKKVGKINWKRRDKKLQQQEHYLLNQAMRTNQEGQKIKEKLAEKVKKYMQDNRTSVTDGAAPGGSQQTLSAFADRLLKECKMKTKRLVVLKLGEEAVELGHNEHSSAGIEENTLIASLCDLLERVWSHGVQLKQLEIGNRGSSKSKYVLRMRQSKSALWSHLLAFQEREKLRLAREFGLEETPNIESEVKKIILELHGGKKNASLDVMTEMSRIKLRTSPEPGFSPGSRLRKASMESTRNRQCSFDASSQCNLDALISAEILTRVEFLCDLRTVQNMAEIMTDTGYARAWTRLSLERKILSTQLKMLLRDRELLQMRYKDYAFIRTDDEMEQFLYHLLSLNAVDFYCFTHGFSNTTMSYKVTVVSTKTIGSLSTANAWIIVSGDLAETGSVAIPKNEKEVIFKHANLGLLTSMRLGHDNSGLSPGWFVDYVTITNETTGLEYRFPCSRWLSRNQDDGSTERLLIADIIRVSPAEDGVRIPRSAESSPCGTLTRTTPTHRKKSNTLPKKSKNQGYTTSDIQEKVADAVNALVKYFYREKEESFTYLLRGDGGFCECMEAVFWYGFKSSRLFGRSMFIWDFIEKVSNEFSAEKDFGQSSDDKRAKKNLCSFVQRINASPQSIGKNEKFHVWICLGLRDHLLRSWLHLISKSNTAAHMYDKSSFLVNRDLSSFLIDVLGALAEFDIILEPSITRGIAQ